MATRRRTRSRTTKPTIAIEVVGVTALRENLRALPPELTNKGLTVATMAAAEIFLYEALTTVPRDEGRLASSLEVQQLRATKTLEAQAAMGPNPDGFYGRFVEYGYGPGTRAARPWLRPAFATGAQRALDAAISATGAFLKRWRPPVPPGTP